MLDIYELRYDTFKRLSKRAAKGDKHAADILEQLKRERYWTYRIFYYVAGGERLPETYQEYVEMTNHNTQRLHEKREKPQWKVKL